MVTPPDPHANAEFYLDVFDEVIKFIALLVGGAWTLMNYLRGRTYKRKLETAITGHLFRKNGQPYVSILCRLKNLGQSKYPIEQRGTGCEVLAYTGGEPQLLWLFTVFHEHGWLEPGEQIDEPLLLRVQIDPVRLIGVRLHLKVASGGIEWNSSCIVESADPEVQPQHA
jgi:hypothetical protein